MALAKTIRYLTVGTTVSTVTLNGMHRNVTIRNRDGAGEVFFCVNGFGGPAGDGVPVVGGNDTESIAKFAGAEREIMNESFSSSGNTTFNLIASVPTQVMVAAYLR